jgi:hypothetical protein
VLAPLLPVRFLSSRSSLLHITIALHGVTKRRYVAGSKSCLPVDNKCQFTSQVTNTTYDLSWFRRGITVSNLETMHFTVCPLLVI